MSKPLHRAYTAIEDTMMVAVRAMVTPRAEKLISSVREALLKDDFAEARRLVDTFTLAPAIEAQRPKLKELGVSAMLFGASRLKPVREVSHVVLGQIPYFVDQAVAQLCNTIDHTVALRVRAAAYLIIHDAEERHNEPKHAAALSKFDPDQPRAPAGTPIGGQWVKQTELPGFKEWSGGAPVIEPDMTDEYKGGPAVFKAFHGTTHPDIEEVDTTPEMGDHTGFLGAGFYTTTSVDDASDNYAGVGPDLEARIERAVEDLTDPFYSDDYVRDEVMRDWLDNGPPVNDIQGKEYSPREWAADREDLPRDFDYDELTDDQKNSLAQDHGDAAIRYAARMRTKGETDGLMMPVYVKVEKPFDFRPNGLQLTIDQKWTDDGDPDGEPTGSGVEFIKALRSVGSDWGADTTSIESYIFENADGASAYDIWKKASDSGIFSDPEGNPASAGAFMQAVAREAGYDGFVMDADQAFPYMRGMESGRVLHVMPFHPNQVKSAIGNSGEFSRTDNRITKNALQPTAVKKIDMTAEEIGAMLSAAVMNGTRMVADVASNVTTSRLASYGFLAEAQKDQITAYKISAVLDDRTCPVCRAMDGETFDLGVSPALDRLEKSLHTDDPKYLRLLAPWPAQDAKTVKEIEEASMEDLQALGYDAPPFHPYCRCILVAVDDQELADTTPEAEVDALEEEPAITRTPPTVPVPIPVPAKPAALPAKPASVATAARLFSETELDIIDGTTVEEAVLQGRRLSALEWLSLNAAQQEIARLFSLEPMEAQAA